MNLNVISELLIPKNLVSNYCILPNSPHKFAYDNIFKGIGLILQHKTTHPNCTAEYQLTTSGMSSEDRK